MTCRWMGFTVARALALAAVCLGSAGAGSGCSGGEAPLFEPSVRVRVTLPGELLPEQVSCLDLVLATPGGQPPATSIGFGGNPLSLKVQNVDLDGDGRPELRIRFVEGSRPFPLSTVDFTLTAASRTDRGAAFTVTATARRADGRLAEDDRCLGGTPLAQGAAQQDTTGAAIRFPDRGDAVVPIALHCLVTGGCAVDGGAGPDGGTGVDGGTLTDGGL